MVPKLVRRPPVVVLGLSFKRQGGVACRLQLFRRDSPVAPALSRFKCDAADRVVEQVVQSSSRPWFGSETASATAVSITVLKEVRAVVVGTFHVLEGPDVVSEPPPDAAATSAGEQPQFPLAGLAPQELQQRRRFGAGEPFSLGHGVTPFQEQVQHPAAAPDMRTRLPAGRHFSSALAFLWNNS